MADRRQEILATAYGIMGTKGLEEVHARTVAAELGVNHATVHYYFRRRADLLQGVADYALYILLEDRARFQEGASTPGERLHNELDLAEAYCRKQSRFVKVLAGLYVASLADAGLKKRLKQLWSAWLGSYVEALPGSKARSSALSDPEFLLASVFGLGLASHMLDGGLNVRSKLEAIDRSLFG